MSIYVQKNGQQIGPLEEHAVRLAIDEGQFDGEDVACISGRSDWQPISRILQLDPAVPPPLPSLPPPLPDSSHLRDLCAPKCERLGPYTEAEARLAVQRGEFANGRSGVEDRKGGMASALHSTSARFEGAPSTFRSAER